MIKATRNNIYIMTAVVTVGFFVTFLLSFIANASISQNAWELAVALGVTLVMQFLAFQFASTAYHSKLNSKYLYGFMAFLLYALSITASCAYAINQINAVINGHDGGLFTGGMMGLFEMIVDSTDYDLKSVMLAFFFFNFAVYESVITLAYVQLVELKKQLVIQKSKEVNQNLKNSENLPKPSIAQAQPINFTKKKRATHTS